MTHDAFLSHLYQHISPVLTTIEANHALLYPGVAVANKGRQQPIHSVYIPADQVHETTIADYVTQAASYIPTAVTLVGKGTKQAAFRFLTHSLDQTPIQDIRFDFEDGYTYQNPASESAHIAAIISVFHTFADHTSTHHPPQQYGIRIPGIGTKKFSGKPDDLHRSLRLIACLLAEPFPSSFWKNFIITVPKFHHNEQIPPLLTLADQLENHFSLPSGTLRFELQIETPQAILTPDGRITLADTVQQANQRLSALHFGTFDYTQSLGISYDQQKLDNIQADFAKSIMILATAGTGIWVSDGSTNIIPSNPDDINALQNHFNLVQRALHQGIYQGWDMHPAHLVTRWLANYQYYTAIMPTALQRLGAYLHQENQTAVLDEPATAKALAATIHRAQNLGLVTDTTLAENSISPTELTDLIS